MSTSKQPQTSNPPDVPAPPPTYNQVSVVALQPHSKLVTLAGQIGLEPLTGKMAPTFVEQVQLAYTNLHKCLAAVGASPRDIVHVRHYIVKDAGDVIDRGWTGPWMEFMDKHAEGHRPPDTVLGVASLARGDILYEVEAWALVNP